MAINSGHRNFQQVVQEADKQSQRYQKAIANQKEIITRLTDERTNMQRELQAYRDMTTQLMNYVADMEDGDARKALSDIILDSGVKP